ncbi:hypothetical protein QE152_g26196 [Popillia japonica]|uniref:Uncharacterized protein n=1 Tax=Popillia japonica TaxID=7064 RepID=A0AAW1JZL8_POPJA
MSDLSDEEPFRADSSDNYEPSDNSNETESEVISETRTRSNIKKRKTKSELLNWKRNVKKKQLASGEAHTSNTGKSVRPARTIGADCRCKKKSYEKINENSRNTILRHKNNRCRLPVQKEIL